VVALRAGVYLARMIRGMVFCCLCAIAAALLLLSSPGQHLEREVGLRFLYATRGNLAAPEGALIVGLDRGSIGWLQRNIDALDDVSLGLDGCLSPLARDSLSRARNINQVPRALHACLVRLLAQRASRLIVFDINFNSETADDGFLAEEVKGAGNVLLLERIEEDDAARRLKPSAPLSDAAAGTVFFQTDGGPGRVVTGYPTRSHVFPTLPSMPVEAWRRHTGREAIATQVIPDFQLIWLYGPAGTVPTVPVRRVFEAGTSGLPADLSRYTVFVGASDASDRSAYDHFKVPLVMAQSDLMGGVELAATAFLNLIRRDRMFSLPPPAQAGVVFCYAFAALIASQFFGGRRALGGVTAISVAYAATAVAFFVFARLWVPIAVPLIIVAPIAVLSAFSAQFAGARRVVERLAPRPFARALLRHPEIGRGDSSIEDATVVFADMVGSTALAERLGEDAFRTVMNRYYSAATAAVEAHDGIVVEYMGDGVLALFTSILAGPDHATKACRAAQQISASPLRQPDGTAPDDQAGFRLRLGIHSGKVVTGPTGAEHRYSFKALGDSVIVAARLEEHGKTLRQDGADMILLSAETRRRVRLPDEQFRPLGATKLRGRQREVEIFRLVPG
jgi:class 3 adenylate cyclase/CHASE2 domain-containing sensor protein